MDCGISFVVLVKEISGIPIFKDIPRSCGNLLCSSLKQITPRYIFGEIDGCLVLY